MDKKEIKSAEWRRLNLNKSGPIKHDRDGTVSFDAGDNPQFKESVAGKTLGVKHDRVEPNEELGLPLFAWDNNEKALTEIESWMGWIERRVPQVRESAYNYWVKLAMTEYAKAYSNLVNQQDAVKFAEWISVEDRLPEIKGFYLVCVTNEVKSKLRGNIEISDLYETVDMEKMKTILKFQDYVTHWMPLPQPPTKNT